MPRAAGRLATTSTTEVFATTMERALGAAATDTAIRTCTSTRRSLISTMSLELTRSSCQALPKVLCNRCGRPWTRGWSRQITCSAATPPKMSFNALLPDGTSALAFSNAVKSCLDRACGAVSDPTYVPDSTCPLAQAPSTDSNMVTTGRASCPQSVSVSIRQISTQAESGGAALTLPSMVCLVLAAVAVLLR